jgi:hypothetical protein
MPTLSFLVILTIILISIIVLCTVNLENTPEEPFIFSVGDAPHGIPDCSGNKPCGIYQNRKRYPLLYAGGIGGSALAIKKDNVDNSHWRLCYRTSYEFYDIWINLLSLIPFFGQPCWQNDFKPVFDYEKRLVVSKKGITFKPKDFGGLNGIKYLGVGILSELTSYVAPMMDYFINEAGYIPGKDLRAITYDWRMGPQELRRDGTFDKIKQLIEQTYMINNNTRVHIAGHSLGAPILSYFLASHVSQEWKDKYIESLISLGGTFGGSPKSSMGLVIGTTFSLPLVTRSYIREVLLEMGGLIWMLPPGDNNDTFLVTNKRSYGNHQLKDLFHDLNTSVTYDVYEHENEINRLQSPGTVVNCIYGYNVSTPVQFKIPDLKIHDHEDEEITRYVDGDSVVPTYSLQLCDKLVEGQNGTKYPVNIHRFDGVTHMSVIEEERIWKKILDITTVPQSKIKH